MDACNRIAGQAAAAASGRYFAVSSRRYPWLEERRWPRSGPEDVERALEAAEAAAPEWLGLGRAERHRRLVRAAEELEASGGCDSLAAPLGLEVGELAELLSERDLRLREGLELLREGAEGPSGAPSPGPGAFAAHWSELAAGALMRLAPRLLAGHPGLVWSDPVLPEAGVLLTLALERAGLPAGTVALLHDDLSTSLEHAAVCGVAWVRARGPAATLRELARGLARRVPPGTAPPELSLWPLQDATAVVLEGDAPALRARELALKAVGRSGTLSGQLPGQVGRVICHQRLFSRFSEEFLHGLEAGSGSAPERTAGAPAVPPGVDNPGLVPLGSPVPVLDGDLPGFVRRAWALGIDEGATPIHGGEPLVGRAEVPAAARAGASATERTRASGGGPADLPADLPFGAGLEDELPRHGRPPAVVQPVVFTNVDPDLRLARLRRPSPVVRLLRAPSDGAARELAAWFERGTEDAPGWRAGRDER